MGLISNVVGTIGSSVSSVVADQYTEFFTCDSLGQNVLVREGAKRMQKGNNKGNAEVISNGSMIAVPEGTACLMVDNGKVVDFTIQAGMYTWDSSSAPTVFAGNDGFLDAAKKLVTETWTRMKMGGEIATQQRIYFVNMLEIKDQKFGTPSALPYHDPEYRNIYIRLNGVFSYTIKDPVKFFQTQVGNVKGEFTNAMFMGSPADEKQPRIEFRDNFSEVLNKCGTVDKIMFADLPSKQGVLRNYMQDALDEEWLKNRGVVISSVAIGGITPDDKSRERIEQVDQSKMFGADPNALAAAAVLGQTEAMNTAAGNANGAVNGLMGMGMVGGMGQMGGGMNSAFQFMGQQQQAQAAQQAAPVAAAAVATAGAAGWACECGTQNTGKFCSNCGKPQP
ncbi:MAG: SPFH domain-containing protein [Clostridiales bacterium]|nr:SPFH domain-containing protein [Clostridiales bacterium]